MTSFTQLLCWPVNQTVVIVISVCTNLPSRTLVTFYVVNVVDNKRRVRPGVDVVTTLARKLHSSTDAFDFRVVALNTVGVFFVFTMLLFCVSLSLCLCVLIVFLILFFNSHTCLL